MQRAPQRSVPLPHCPCVVTWVCSGPHLSTTRTRDALPLCRATWDDPSHQGGLVAARGFSLGTGHWVHSTELGVSPPGQGQPEFSRSRTILGNTCSTGTTNMFVSFQCSLLRLSQTPPFPQQKSQSWEECSPGDRGVFPLI